MINKSHAFLLLTIFMITFFHPSIEEIQFIEEYEGCLELFVKSGYPDNKTHPCFRFRPDYHKINMSGLGRRFN